MTDEEYKKNFKEDTCITNIEKVNHFLDEAKTFY